MVGPVFWSVVILNAAVGAGFCCFVAQQRGRDQATWAALGFFFGLFALLALGFSPDAESSHSRKPHRLDMTKRCPQCAEVIKIEALKCRYCSTEFSQSDVEEEITRYVTTVLVEDPHSLHAACIEGNAAVAKLLLDSGRRHPPDPRGLQPLHYAVQEQQTQIVRLLLERGGNPNLTFPGFSARSLLFKAVSLKNLALVEALLSGGARPTGRRRELALAVKLGQTAIADALVRHGASITPSILPVVTNTSNAETVASYYKLIVAKESEQNAEENRLRATTAAERSKREHIRQIKRQKEREAKLAEKAETAEGEAEGPAADFFTCVCPGCGAALRIPNQFAGATGRCNHCGGSIIPEPDTP